MAYLSDENPSYVQGDCDVPLVGSTIGDLLAGVTERSPENEALVSCHQKLKSCATSTGNFRTAATASHGLIGCGVMTGDRIGIWSPNYAEWIADLGGGKLGNY